MKISRIALAVAAVSLGALGVVAFRTPNRPSSVRRSVKPTVILPADPERPEPVVVPVAKTESAPTPIPEVHPEPVVTEVAVTPEVAEFGAMLELSEDLAARAFDLLRARDEAAERILEPYGGELSPAVILAMQPQLRLLDEEADRSIESMLSFDQRQRYRTLRAEGFIAGTMLELPPAQVPDLDEDE